MTQLSTPSTASLEPPVLPDETVVLPKFMQYVYQVLDSKPRLSYWQQRLLAWDTWLCLRVNALSHRQLIAVGFKTVSRLGDGWAWALATFISVMGLYQRGMAGVVIAIKVITVLLSSFCGYLLYKLLKCHTVRPRPYQVHQAIMLGERPLDVFSFPSGHTLQAVLFTMMLGSLVPGLLWVLVPFTILIALSRLVLGLHYPTDVLVGAGIGAVFGSLGKMAGDSVINSYLA